MSLSLALTAAAGCGNDSGSTGPHGPPAPNHVRLQSDAGDYIGYQTESGTWSVEGDVEHISADMINGDAAMTSADYKIVLLTDNERRIRLDPQGYIFIGHRVQKFEFPDCANGI